MRRSYAISSYLEEDYSMSKPYIRVAAGVILNQNQQVLLAQRPEGKPWSGWWEFPGGKIEEDESVNKP